jgi:hypothetical protein
MRVRLYALCLNLVLTALALAEVPETYRVIVQRNLFSPSRAAVVARPVSVVSEAPPPTETVTLTGVVSLGGQLTALFSGPSPGLGGVRRPGERLDLGLVSAVDTAGVTLDTGADSGVLRLAVGQSLHRVVGQPWALSSDAAPAGARPSAPSAAAGSVPAAGSAAEPAAAADSAEMLRRLLERRKKELTP